MSLYLSRYDLAHLAHYAHYIPATKGYSDEMVRENYPGWSFNELWRLVGPLAQRAKFVRPKGMSPLPDDVIGVLITGRNAHVLDDGSLEHPAKVRSWERRALGRLSEQCDARSLFSFNPVIVHLPRASRHVPACARGWLAADDASLAAALDASTDDRLMKVVDGLSEPNWNGAGFVWAAMSSLVLDNDIEAPGPEGWAGDERRRWLFNQRAAYEQSMANVVAQSIQRHSQAVLVNLTSSTAGTGVRIGTDAAHTPEWLVEMATRAFHGYDVETDDPSAGRVFVPPSIRGDGSPVYAIDVSIGRAALSNRTRIAAATTSARELIRAAARNTE